MIGLFDHTEPQAARILGVSTRTLKGYRRDGRVGYHRLPGGGIRYQSEQLADFLQATRVPPTSPVCPILHNVSNPCTTKGVAIDSVAADSSEHGN